MKTHSFAPMPEKAFVKASDLEGHLVVLEVIAYHPEHVTLFGPKPAIEITVHDIDDELTYEDQKWINVVFVEQLRKFEGQRFLVRIVQGTAKAGQQAPWLPQDASKDDVSVRRAQAYLALRSQ